MTPHPAYTALAATPEAQGMADHRLMHEALSDEDIAAIRSHLRQQRALGRDDFRVMVEAKTQRFARVRPAHGPRMLVRKRT